MIAPRSTAESLLDKTTELSVRLKLSEELNRKLKKDLADLEPLREANARLQSELTSALEKNAVMAEDLRWFRSQLFGRSSEKRSAETSVDQRMLFNEAEICAAIAAADEAAATRTVRPGGRPAIPAHLPRKEIVHELSFQERACCGDDQITWLMQPIGRSEPAERYHYEPAKVWVEQHIQVSYTCPCGHEGVRTAPAPHILPKTNASASLMAQNARLHREDLDLNRIDLFRLQRRRSQQPLLRPFEPG